MLPAATYGRLADSQMIIERLTTLSSPNRMHHSKGAFAMRMTRGRMRLHLHEAPPTVNNAQAFDSTSKLFFRE